jgi:putative hydrolase of the HAD superfamily
MLPPALELIGFDADDTLWHNERSYRDARARFCRLLTENGVALDPTEIDTHVNRIEAANLQYYGYGVSSFVMSLLEAAVELTEGRIKSGDLRPVIALAKEMIAEEVELFDGSRGVVAALASRYPLVLITKGQLLHQTSKLDRSGLREFFRFVEVVSHKTADVYASILARHNVSPARFLMVGNSLRSDILPVLEIGGWAAHVPADLSWAHEDADLPEGPMARHFDLAKIDGLPDVVATIEQALEETGKRGNGKRGNGETGNGKRGNG